jgi:3-hydroxyacyl-[acyl-carrier-protein] dehydratase
MTTDVELPPIDVAFVGINDLLQMIPHRYPFLLLDRLVDIRRDHSATGIKNVSVNEPFFQGHFPGHPVMPGVLIIESMAQTAAALVISTLGPVENPPIVRNSASR